MRKKASALDALDALGKMYYTYGTAVLISYGTISEVDKLPKSCRFARVHEEVAQPTSWVEMQRETVR